MQAEQKTDLAAQIKRVAASGKTYFYWLCPKGEDDEPVLLLEKKEGPLVKAAKAARKAAKVKLFSRGQVTLGGDDRLQFVHHEGSLEPKKAQKVMKTKLGTAAGLEKVAVRLKKAVFLSLEEFEQLDAAPAPAASEARTDDPPPTRGAAVDLDRAVERWEGLTDEARDTLGAAHPFLTELAADTQRATRERKQDPVQAAATLEALIQGFDGRLAKQVKAAWKAEVEAVKPLFVQARDHLVGVHQAGGMDAEGAKAAAVADPRYLRMKEAQQAAYALKSTDLPAALDALEQVQALAERILSADDAPDGDALASLEAELFDVDFSQSRDALAQAFEAVDRQIAALQGALRAHPDARLQRIGEYGFNAVTGNHKTPLMAALLEAKLAGDDREARDKAARRAAAKARDLRDHLRASPLLRAMADPPQGLPAVHATDLLTPALDELADIV